MQQKPEEFDNRIEIQKCLAEQEKFLQIKKKIETIDNFDGIFSFLNNEFRCEIYYQGRHYPSVFHASQAARTNDITIREKISLAHSIQELWQLASKIKDPLDWQDRR